MAECIRIVITCNALRIPSPQGDILARIGAGSELSLLRDDDRDYYKVAYGGVPVFVSKSNGIRVDSDLASTGPAASLPPIAGQAVATPGVGPLVRLRPARASETGNWFLSLLRVAGLIIALGMAASGVTMIIAAAPVVVDPENSVGLGYGLGIGGGVLLIFGLTLLRFTVRPLLQFVVILSGIAFVIGGIELLIFSIPLSRMAHGEIDPDRAGNALVIGGGIVAVLGIAMALFAVLRWLGNPESRARWPDVVRWAAVVYGGMLVFAGGGVPVSMTATVEDYVPTLQDAAAIGAVIPLTLLPGAVLGYHGLTMLRHGQEGPFRFLTAGALLALFALAVAFGAIVVIVEEPLVWLMSGAHAAAALLPALALVALASRGGLRGGAPVAGLTHRQVWVSLALGAVGVTLVAATVDSLMAQTLATALLAAGGAFDGLRAFEEVGDVLVNPDLYLSQGQELALLLIVVVVMAPIMEEGFKGLGVALVLPRRPTMSAALTVGIAVGAGFGVFEAASYGLGGLGPDSTIDWWSLMLIRGGATTMHALNTGLLGLALYYDRSEGRWRRAFMLYAVAVGLHGLWNGLAVLAGSRVIYSFEGLTDRELSWLVLAVMAPLGLAVFGALYVVVRRAYLASPKVGDPEEPATGTAAVEFEPWLG